MSDVKVDRDIPKSTRIREGLALFESIGHCTVDAQHDVLYAAADKAVSDEQSIRLRRLGWHWDSDVDSWAIFT